MGIAGTTGLAVAGGALAGGLVGLGVLQTRPPELFGLMAVTGVAGALTGIAAGVAGRHTAPLKAALIGAGVAGLLPAGLYLNAQRAAGDEQVFGEVAATLAGVGIAGGAAALIGRALLRR